MDYRVAMDNVPAGKSGSQGLMAVNWMEAAGQGSIPTAFIVDKQSRIAWIGHPMTMERPLSQIVAGRWDTKQEAVRINQQQAAALKLREAYGKIQAAYQANDYPRVVTLIDAASNGDPVTENRLSYLKYTMLLKLNRDDQAAALGNKLATGMLRHNPQGLNSLAWLAVDPAAKRRSPSLVAMALTAVQKADRLSLGRDAAIVDTLAAAYFASGQTAKAVETQDRAVNLAKGTKMEHDPAMAQHLAMYKQARK